MGRNLPVRTRRFSAKGVNKRTRRFFNPRYFRGLGDRAILAPQGTGNAGFQGHAKTPGTGGNSISFRVVVSGNNTAPSVGVSGSAVTFNAATNGSGQSISTVDAMIDAVNRAQELIWLSKPKGSDGTSAVAALSATSLSGGS